MGQFFNIFTAAFCSIGSFLFGYDGGIIASIITFNTFKVFVGHPHNYNSLSGAVVSTFTGGCFLGAAIAGWTNDKIGRKRSIQLGSLIAIWGCAMQAGANNFACLLTGRIVAGFAVGYILMMVFTEIAPPKIRGFVVGLTQQMIGIGFMVANWVSYACQFLDGNAGWRLALGLQLVPATLLLVGIQFSPYSPRWLIEQGRENEAWEVVCLLHGVKTEEDKTRAKQEFIEMQDTIKAEASQRSRNISELWATPAMLKRTLVAVGVQVFSQFSGVNGMYTGTYFQLTIQEKLCDARQSSIINFFGPSLYSALGLSHGQSLLVQGIHGAVGPVTTFFFIIFILDAVGRRKPLIFGTACFTLTYVVLTIITVKFPPSIDGIPNPHRAAQRAGIAMIFLISFFYNMSFGAVSWVLASEVFPTRTRAIGTSVATCSNWLFNILFSQVSNIAIANIGWKYYLLFICLNAVDFVIVILFFPDTKGKTLEEMSEIFGDRVDAVTEDDRRSVKVEEKAE